MKLRYAVATGALTALGLGAIGTGVAMAQPTPGGATTGATTVAPAPSHGSQDGDTVQQGDKNTPDMAGQGDETATSEAPDSSVEAADNPAGHADPAGNVEHDGGANEP